jgi:PAS domain S-box-containing protein
MPITGLNRPRAQQNVRRNDATTEVAEISASILLVDDYPANLAALEATLEPLGHRLIKAISGRQAIELLAREEVAVVLMDVRMPGLDGFKTAELMRSRWCARSTPVIFLTAADTDTAAILDGYARGAADFLVRPFEPEILRCKVAVFVDLYLKEQTIRHQAAALRQRERETLERKTDLRFRKLVDAMPLCVVVTDSQSRPVYWNDSALTYTGMTPDGMTSGYALLDSVHSTDREHLSQLWTESIANHRRFELKFRIRGRDGLYRWYLGRGIPQHGDTDAVTGWILTATDIEAENQALLQAEGANRIKDEFLATVSHELRNPLNAIVGWVNLLQSGSLDSAGSKRALETIERNVHLQASLIDEILDLSRIAKGKVHLTLRQFDLIPLIESALDVVRPRAEAKNLQVESAWHGPPVHINGDSERLQQVISNLMSNAVKFTPAGGRVRVSLERGVREVTLTVRDTGRGIGAEFLPFVFDMFRQADSGTTREHEGLGLGLAIARKLVELHGGRISADSEGVDKGATFSVTLPLQTVQVRPAQQGGSEISNVQPRTLEKTKILIVEDHSDSREALAELLRRLGAVTASAESAQEALAAIEREVPDVLISDIAMPGRDGFALMQTLNEHPAKKAGRIVSVALTGLSDPLHARRALQEGFDVCMVKPLDLGRLIEYVATAVRRSAEHSRK